MQLGGSAIDVNRVCPSVMMTRLSVALPPEQHTKQRESAPLGNIGHPRDPHGAVLVLASAASDYITGPDLLISGRPTLSSRPLPARDCPPRASESEKIEEMMRDLATLKHPDHKSQ